jgi:hypothetical protein
MFLFIYVVIFFELSRITMNLLQILELNVIHYLTKQ